MTFLLPPGFKGLTIFTKSELRWVLNALMANLRRFPGKRQITPYSLKNFTGYRILLGILRNDPLKFFLKHLKTVPFNGLLSAVN